MSCLYSPGPLYSPDPTARVPEIFLCLHLPTMLIMIGLFMVYILWAVRQGRFKKWFGYPLLVLYTAYLIINFAVEAGNGAG